MIKVKDCPRRKDERGLPAVELCTWKLQLNPCSDGWDVKVSVNGHVDFTHYKGEWYVADEWLDSGYGRSHAPFVYKNTLQMLDRFMKQEANKLQ